MPRWQVYPGKSVISPLHKRALAKRLSRSISALSNRLRDDRLNSGKAIEHRRKSPPWRSLSKYHQLWGGGGAMRALAYPWRPAAALCFPEPNADSGAEGGSR